MSHFSYNSCTGLNQLFKVMFPDREIAANFALDKTKCRCMLLYGIAPVFKAKLPHFSRYRLMNRHNNNLFPSKKGLFWLLYDSPASRDVYQREGNTVTFPLNSAKRVG